MALLACVVRVIAGACVAGGPAGRTMTAREMNAAADWLEGLHRAVK